MLRLPKNAQEIMVTRLVTLSPAMHVSDGIERLFKHKITGMPVVDNDQNFLGVFSEKCLMKILGAMTRNVSGDGKGSSRSVRASDFMVSKLLTFSPDTDVLEAVGLLLKNRFSGAPVIDKEGKFVGTFSEKSTMQVLITSAYEQLPATHVSAFMNPDPARIISAETDLFDVAQKFADTPFRRLEVVDPDSGKLMGQISRRDVLSTEQKLPGQVRHQVNMLASKIAAEQGDSNGDLSNPDSTPSVATFMDRNARTITENTDFLGVARIFLDTPYRRLPVLNNGKVVGQISRRDVLQAADKLIAIDPPPREKTILYLSSLIDRQDAPFG